MNGFGIVGSGRVLGRPHVCLSEANVFTMLFILILFVAHQFHRLIAHSDTIVERVLRAVAVALLRPLAESVQQLRHVVCQEESGALFPIWDAIIKEVMKPVVVMLSRSSGMLSI